MTRRPHAISGSDEREARTAAGHIQGFYTMRVTDRLSEWEGGGVNRLVSFPDFKASMLPGVVWLEVRRDGRGTALMVPFSMFYTEWE